MVKMVKKAKMEYKSTKIPRYVFDGVELAKAKILIERTKQFPPEVFMPNKCPICGGKMQGLDVRARVTYQACNECGYKQPSIDISAKGTDVTSLAAALGLGTLFGFGIAALLYLISQSNRKATLDDYK